MFIDDGYNIKDAFRLGDIEFTNPNVLPQKCTPLRASVKGGDTTGEKSIPFDARDHRAGTSFDKGVVVPGLELDNHGQGKINEQGGHTIDSKQMYGHHAAKAVGAPSDKTREKADVFLNDGYNIRDAFRLGDIQLTNPNVLPQNSDPVDASAKVGDTSGDKTDIPVTDVDSGTDFGLTQLNESQWRELEIKALEEVKSRVPNVDQFPPIIEDNTNGYADLTGPAATVPAATVPAAPVPGVPDVTPQVRARERKLSKFNRSPFVNDFGSGKTSSPIVKNFHSDRTCSQLAKRPTFQLMHPLLREIRIEPDIEISNEWCPWIDYKAIVKSKVGKLYPTGVNNLYPSFNFGVHVVDKKEWFHILNYGSKTIRTTHMDVLFYYLRKKAKYDHDITVRVTTTDCLFDATIRDVYNEFIRSGNEMGIVDSATLINDYICGRTLRCNTPWALVDDVLFPVMVIHDWHWILARLSFKERAIYVYDSRPDLAAYNEEIIQALQPYANMLPLFLTNTDFLKKRPELFYKGSPYEDKSLVELFLLDFSIQVPSLMKCDYGVYAAVFAEYYIQYQCMPTDDDDLSGVRGRYAMYLWHYGMTKQLAGAVSDEDN